MADKGRAIKDILNDMRNIRATNNDLWMMLVRLAIETAPEAAKSIIQSIQHQDQKIANLWQEIANVPDDTN